MTEEIVTIKRRSGTREIWKINFSELSSNNITLLETFNSNNIEVIEPLLNLMKDRLHPNSPYIVPGNELQTIKNLQKALKIICYITDPGQVMDFLWQNSDIKIFQDINKFDLTQNILYKPWNDTIKFDLGPRIGRGEICIKLKFAFDLVSKEPDFISFDKKKRFSIKFFGNGKGKVKNSDKPLNGTNEFLAKIKSIIKKELPPTIGVDFINENIKKINYEDCIFLLNQINKMKNSFLTEHGINGIISVYDKNTKFINLDNFNEELEFNSILTSTKRSMFNLKNIENKCSSVEEIFLKIKLNEYL